jgi:hypothetical protein
MNPTRTCPHCGRTNPNSNGFCSTCGGKIKTSGGGLATKLLLGVFLLLVVVVWTTSLTQPRRDVPLPQTSQAPQYLTTATSAAPPAQANSLELSSAQHLAEAKRALADGYKPSKDPKKATWGEVAAARWHLKAVGSAAPEYREAQELLKEVARRERQIEIAAKPVVAEVEPTQESASAAGAGIGAAGSNDSSLTAPVPRTAPAPPSAEEATGGAVINPTTPPTPRTGGTTSGDYYKNVDGQEVRRPTFSSSVPAGATAQCRDGSYSFSQNRRGTCSHHGGVDRWL